MIKCNQCSKIKALDDFAWKNKAAEIRNSTCKDCQREYAKAHYENKKNYYLQKAKKNSKNAISRNKEIILNHLYKNPCVDCGEKDVNVLEFDHIEMIKGSGYRISNFLKYSESRLRDEINKCEVRCANCHTRRTRHQMGWYRL